jgi:hypothetical protein
MPRIPIPFVGGLQEGLIPRINSQRTVNFYPQVEGAGARVPVSLRHCPGLKRIAAVGAGPLRSNLVYFNGDIYGVWGPNLVQVDLAGNHTVIGTLNGSDRVTFAWTVRELCAVDGANYVYSYRPGASPEFQATSLGGIGTLNPTTIAMKDFYFFINRTEGDAEDKGDFFASDLLDGRTWTGASKNAEAQPDGIVAIVATANNVICVGEWSAQHYFNPGDTSATFPLDPARGQDIGWGTPAPQSVGQIEDTIIFLGRIKQGGLRVIMHPGGPISTPELEETIANFSVVDDAVAFTYAQGDAYFYQLTFPSEDRTFVYSTSAKLWFEKQSWGYGRHLSTGAVQVNGKLWVGVENNGYIYQWDSGTYTDDGTRIYRERRAPVLFSQDASEIFIDEIRLMIDTGTQALDTTAAVWLDVSSDGGHTFENEITLDCGEHGDYRKVVEATNMGACGRDVIFRLRTTDPAPWTILGAAAKFSKGDF